jgi:ParB family chromosome partitioning protein
LDALLGLPAEQAQGVTEADQLRSVPVDLIERGRFQPRVDMHPETLQELADSIKSQGVVQPILIRPTARAGRYEIVAGERRWRAAQLAGLHEIPALVRNVPDHAAMSIALIENIQREQLNPIEEAYGLERLINEFGMTHQGVAEAIGRSRAAVTNLLRLLELVEEVRGYVERRELEMGHARALVTLPAAEQLEAARRIIARGMSVRQAEHLVKTWKSKRDGGAERKQDPNIQFLERDLSERLGAPVAIRHGAGGKGQVTIRYHSLDELQGILDHIK